MRKAMGKMHVTWFAVVSLMLAALIVASPADGGMRAARAAAGDLDTTYGDDGITSSRFYYDGNHVLVDPQGRVIAGGTNYVTFPRPALVRYTVDGRLDPTFSRDGRMTLPAIGDVHDLQWRNGKILVLAGSGRSHILFQVTEEGRLDRTYGSGDGFVDLPGGASSWVQVAPDGVVYFVATRAHMPRSTLVFKLDGDTIVDRALIPTCVGCSWGRLALTPDGAYLYAVGSFGYTDGVWGASLVQVTRIRTSDMSLTWSEPTYGPRIDGQSSSPAGATVIARNGKVMIAGGVGTYTGGDTSGFLMRVDTDGEIELWRTFGVGRISYPSDIVMQDVKPVVVGYAGGDPSADGWAVWRFTAQGFPDLSFGGGAGYVITTAIPDDAARDVAVWKGRIVASGHRYTARYLAA